MACLHCQLATGKVKTHTWHVGEKKRFIIVDDPQTGAPLAVMCDHLARESKGLRLEIVKICSVAFGEGKVKIKRRSGHLAYAWVRESRSQI